MTSMQNAQTWMGCTTSVDLVQQQQYNTTPIHGVKRPNEQTDIAAQTDSAFKSIPGVLSARDHAKRRCFGLSDKTRIIASQIYSIATNPAGFGAESHARQHIPLTPGPSQNPLLSLSHPKYNLPKALVNNFAALGINSIYPWQSSCLLGHGLLDGSRNLVYTAPTGGGKSLVADVLMLKRVIEDPTKKAILVLPYVALVQEKLKWLRRVIEGVQKNRQPLSQCDSQLPKWRRPHDSSVRVAGFFGGSKARATWSDVDIAVCTIEKVG